MPRPCFFRDAASPSAFTGKSWRITLGCYFIVIISAIIGTLVCVLVLIAIATCAWFRCCSSFSANGIRHSLAVFKANKALKKILRLLPKRIFTSESAADFSNNDCVVCLSEFNAGDELTVLPHCGHAFHSSCIAKWLVCHSSCPLCRRMLDV